MTGHPPLELVDVYAATLPGLTFVPQLHVNYAETVLPMRDGLPKLKDFPSDSAAQARPCRTSGHRPTSMSLARAVRHRVHGETAEHAEEG